MVGLRGYHSVAAMQDPAILIERATGEPVPRGRDMMTEVRLFMDCRSGGRLTGTTVCRRGQGMSDRAWILLPSGKQLDLLAPDPWAWTDDDLAIGLSRTYRWAGYSAWDLPLSVAQHSLAVRALRRSQSAERPLPTAEEGASCCTTRPRR